MGKDLFGTYLVGMYFGAAIGMSLMSCLDINVENIQTFQRKDGKPAVFRVYKPGQDIIGVNTGRFVRLENHLNSISNEHDRIDEEDEIRRITKWYGELRP